MLFQQGLYLLRSLMDRRARWADESVSTEYGLILFFIAAVIIGAVIAFGVILVSLFEQAPPALDP